MFVNFILRKLGSQKQILEPVVLVHYFFSAGNLLLMLLDDQFNQVIMTIVFLQTTGIPQNGPTLNADSYYTTKLPL